MSEISRTTSLAPAEKKVELLGEIYLRVCNLPTQKHSIVVVLEHEVDRHHYHGHNARVIISTIAILLRADNNINGF